MFHIDDRYEKVFLLRIMKEAREALAVKLLAIEAIDHQQPDKVNQVGERATLAAEMNVLNRMIDDMWSSISSGPPMPGVVDPTVPSKGVDGHPIPFLLVDPKLDGAAS